MSVYSCPTWHSLSACNSINKALTVLVQSLSKLLLESLLYIQWHTRRLLHTCTCICTNVCMCVRRGGTTMHEVKTVIATNTLSTLSACFRLIMSLTELQQRKIFFDNWSSNYHQPGAVVADSNGAHGVRRSQCQWRWHILDLEEVHVTVSGMLIVW